MPEENKLPSIEIEPIVTPAVQEETYDKMWVTDFVVKADKPTEASLYAILRPCSSTTGAILVQAGTEQVVSLQGGAGASYYSTNGAGGGGGGGYYGGGGGGVESGAYATGGGGGGSSYVNPSATATTLTQGKGSDSDRPTGVAVGSPAYPSTPTSGGNGAVVISYVTTSAAEQSVLKASDGVNTNETGTIQLGSYSGTTGTDNVIDGLTTKFNVLGNNIGTLTSTGMVWSQSLQASGYKSSDGTAGMTGTCSAFSSWVIKNGLVVSCN